MLNSRSQIELRAWWDLISARSSSRLANLVCLVKKMDYSPPETCDARHVPCISPRQDSYGAVFQAANDSRLSHLFLIKIIRF